MHNTLDAAAKGRLLRIASYASVSTAVLLIVVKMAAWLVTGSVSMLASLVDSLMDSMASLILLLAVHYSLQPADAEHRFGHGKAEPLAGQAQACFICGSAVFLLFHALERLRRPFPVEDIAIGVGVMIFATVLTIILLLLQRYVIQRTDSTAVRADALHYASDLLSNGGVILALWLSSLGFGQADPVLAMAVAGYIFFSASRIGREAIAQLMDRELSEEVQQSILSVALEQPQVRGVHDLRTRQAGQIKFIQLHLELDDLLPLYQAHAIADRVERDIQAVFPDAQIIVHEDPASLGAKERGDYPGDGLSAAGVFPDPKS